MTRIDTDFNSVRRDGLVRVSRRSADADFGLGDTVELYDASDDEMSFTAVVESMDGAGRGWARVHWEPAHAQPSLLALLQRAVDGRTVIAKIETNFGVATSVPNGWPARAVTEPVFTPS